MVNTLFWSLFGHWQDVLYGLSVIYVHKKDTGVAHLDIAESSWDCPSKLFLCLIYFHNVCLIYINFLSLSVKRNSCFVLRQPRGCCDWCIPLSLGASTLSRHICFVFLKIQAYNSKSMSLLIITSCEHASLCGFQDYGHSSETRLKSSDNKHWPMTQQWRWKKTLFLWVWWHASLKMTTCKNCLEDPIKYVWNWVFKGGKDRQIHHPIVKCRNTIKVWIFSIVFLDTAQKATDKKKAENMILILHDFHTMQFFLPTFECINYQHRCPIRRISPETVCQFTKKASW